jgi:hypothetical protein
MEIVDDDDISYCLVSCVFPVTRVLRRQCDDFGIICTTAIDVYLCEAQNY